MKRFFITLIFLGGSIVGFCQQTFENQFVRIHMTTTIDLDSAQFILNLTNKSSESIFVPIQNTLHSRIWASSSSIDLIELELGYDLKMVTEGNPSLARVKSGQTVEYIDRVAIKAGKDYTIKFKVNLFMSKHETFLKRKVRLEWFTLDYRVP